MKQFFLQIIQSSKTGASPSDVLILYPGHSLGESYLSTEMQLVYSTAPANWAIWYKSTVVKMLWLEQPRQWKESEIGK